MMHLMNPSARKMSSRKQKEWLERHIPHRVRAAIALLPNMSGFPLRVNISVQRPAGADEISWRCLTDSIWEGRLTAVRWLIEFVGVKQDADGNPAAYRKKPGRKKAGAKRAEGKDVLITDFHGGTPVSHLGAEGKRLAYVWKGCSQASSHATRAYRHPSVSDQRALPRALKIILQHLQGTIYKEAGIDLRDYVLQKPPV